VLGLTCQLPSTLILPAGWPGRLLHSRTRPLEKRVVEGDRRERTRKGRKLLSTLLAFSGVNSGTRVVLMLERTPQKVVHLTTNTSPEKTFGCQSVVREIIRLSRYLHTPAKQVSFKR
jgi:hypothetical protein